MTDETDKPSPPPAKEQLGKPVPGKRFIIAMIPPKKNPPPSPKK